MAKPPVHYGRSQRYASIRVVAIRNSSGNWRSIETTEGKKVGRYPTPRAVETARAVTIGGKIEEKDEQGNWFKVPGTKFVTSHTPFTKRHTIDDFADRSEDRYNFRWI